MSETEKQVVGRLGEDTACKFLVKRGLTIIDRNYLKKWGEIDIVAQNNGKWHFVEVKTVSRENLRDISHETLDSYRPEDNVHPQKLLRLSRAVQSYLLEKKIESEWQFDVIAVFLDLKNREARCRYLEDVVL
ncbi:hypothetical protein A3D62_03060 [Candidatus Kaiserbacteria bacterium RIFCSPHIGHO2_02_FULL_49_11]|uniref:UPF0102 protein A3D62_03060 n=1 Tax=Candidatus Kaiserbacteria bacterium RIFCSPHIGHO2_02_FULL_49_11 TaxID=1798489 RepID=A0A1F6D0V4_9BACT|nr:MAG: hypothetical protein A3D62_03060 [Candidatus Kaiserbacteria bacterium RIFCSPHIGHO2_02_FULL_49_11]